MSAVDIGALYEALDIARKRGGYSWREVGRRVGVSPSTLTRMVKGKSPDLEGFGKMVLFLGVSADDFLNREETTRLREEHLPIVVDKHLRKTGELSRNHAKALLRIVQVAYDELRILAEVKP